MKSGNSERDLYSRPIIVVSSCLGFKPTRYDGNIVYDKVVEALRKYVEFIPFCPEVEAGLGVPRNQLVLVREDNELRLMDVVTGINQLERVVEASRRFLGGLAGVDGFLLKSNSPSCGVKDAKLYSTSKRVLSRVDGVFTGLIRETYRFTPVESEMRLLKYDIRKNYFTRVFSLAEAREKLLRSMSQSEIVDFHRRYKYILLLYSPSSLRKLGRIVAERSAWSIDQLVSEYYKEFLLALSKTPKRSSYANALRHIYSHFKDRLELKERDYVRKLIEGYEKGVLSLEIVFAYLRGFIYRFSDQYLAEQRFIQPYPRELDLLVMGERMCFENIT